MLPPRPLQAPSGQHRVSGRPYSGSKAAAPKLGGPSSPPSAGPSASPGQEPPPGGFPASSSPLVTLLRVPPLLPVLGCRGTQRGKDGVLALICISAEQRAPPPVPAEAGGGGWGGALGTCLLPTAHFLRPLPGAEAALHPLRLVLVAQDPLPLGPPVSALTLRNHPRAVFIPPSSRWVGWAVPAEGKWTRSHFTSGKREGFLLPREFSARLKAFRPHAEQ